MVVKARGMVAVMTRERNFDASGDVNIVSTEFLFSMTVCHVGFYMYVP